MVADQTMTLAQALSTPSSSSGHGIVPRAVHELFQALEQRSCAVRACSAAAASCAAAGSAASLAGTAAGEVKLVLSYLEIYNDRLYDLLQPHKPGSSRCACRSSVKHPCCAYYGAHVHGLRRGRAYTACGQQQVGRSFCNNSHTMVHSDMAWRVAVDSQVHRWPWLQGPLPACCWQDESRSAGGPSCRNARAQPAVCGRAEMPAGATTDSSRQLQPRYSPHRCARSDTDAFV
jgi:hypothetical protein